MSVPNKYTVHQRLTNAENRCAQLEAEVKALRVHLAGALQTAVNDAKSVIQDSIRVPLDGRDGVDGRDGATGPQGIQGIQGAPGKDCTMPTDSELADAVNALRLRLAKWQAAIQFAYEQNYGTKHQGLKKAIELTLQTVEKRANS